jgi:hypothetical protein
MAKTYAYIETGETFVTLGHVGISLYITSGTGSKEKTIGTLYVSKSGIRWLPKKKWTVRKGKNVVGTPIGWNELDKMAADSEQ